MSQSEPKKSGWWTRQRVLAAVGLGVVLAGLASLGVWTHHAAANKGGDRKLCGANLEAVGRACLAYAAAHQGNFPPSLSVLTESSAGAPLQASQLACPNNNKKGRKGEFVYVPGHRRTDDPTAVLAYEQLGNHKKKPGGHVLFVTGAVRWMEEAEYNSTMAQVRNHLAPTSSGH